MSISGQGVDASAECEINMGRPLRHVRGRVNCEILTGVTNGPAASVAQLRDCLGGSRDAKRRPSSCLLTHHQHHHLFSLLDYIFSFRLLIGHPSHLPCCGFYKCRHSSSYPVQLSRLFFVVFIPCIFLVLPRIRRTYHIHDTSSRVFCKVKLSLYRPWRPIGL
jgi:hypothetical protein